MGLRFRIFLGMMAVVVCALVATGYVAYRYGVDAESTYNAQRLLRKEAALQRSLSYMLNGWVEQWPKTVWRRCSPTAFVSLRMSTA